MHFIAYNKNQKGFTMIELIIAFFILSIAVIGIYSAFYAMVILSEDSTDRLTATYLSQEGIEIMRNYRDANWVACETADCSFTFGECNNPNGCQIDYKMTQISAWARRSDQTYGNYFCNANGFFTYENECEKANITRFKRRIQAISLNNIAVKIISEVSWDQKANLLNSGKSAGGAVCDPTNCIQIEETLYDWF